MTESTDPVAAAAALLTRLAAAGTPSPLDLARQRAALADRTEERVREPAADRALADAVDTLWDRGWTPRDVVEAARRRLPPGDGPLVADLLAGDAARRPATWSLAGVDARVWWDPGRPLTAQWRTGRGLTATEVLTAALRVVGELRRLPPLPAGAGGGVGGVAEADLEGLDPRVLARVRGLLAKAESTTFAEEAEALSAKAQELMARHALARAVVDAGRGHRPPPAAASARRLWLDAPYTSAKSSLVHQVAGANRCRAVSLEALDLVTVVGHPPDLDTVELLVTSLLVQAGRAMLAEGPRTGHGGGSRTRSFRHAFLLSYATRIGERLREAAEAAEAAARAEAGDALLPVLAARGEVVERTVAELFPRLTTKRFSIRNTAGWDAGRAAADAANLRVGREALDS